MVQTNNTYEDIKLYLKHIFSLNNHNYRSSLYKNLAIFAHKNKNSELADIFFLRANEIFLEDFKILKSDNLISKYREMSAFYFIMDKAELNFEYLEKRKCLVEKSTEVKDYEKLIRDYCTFYKKEFQKTTDKIKKEEINLRLIECFHKLEDIYIKNGLTKELDGTYLDLVKSYKWQKDYKKVEEYYLRKLDLYLDDTNFLAKDVSFSLLINFYETIKNYQQANIYYKKQLDFRIKSGFIDKIAKAYGFYGKFLENKMCDIEGAHKCFLEELRLLKENCSGNVDKIVTAHRTLGDFYLKHHGNIDKNPALEYEKAFNTAYVNDNNELIFFMLNYYSTHMKISLYMDLKPFFDKIQKKLVDREEFLTYAYYLHPILKKYHMIKNQKNEVIELEKNLMVYYSRGKLSECFYQKILEDVIVAKQIYKKKKQAFKKDQINMYGVINAIENAVSILMLMEEKEHLFKVFEESVKFYIQVSKTAEAKTLIDMWILCLDDTCLDITTLAEQYVILANIHWAFDHMKYFQYYEQYIAFSENYENKSQIKYKKLLKKAKEINNDNLIKKYWYFAKISMFKWSNSYRHLTFRDYEYQFNKFRNIFC